MTAAVASTGFALPGAALAQSYPEKQTTIIAPTCPGSLVDILARLIAEGMRETRGAAGHRKERQWRRRV